MSATMRPDELRRTVPDRDFEPSLTPAQRLAQAAQLRPFKTKDVDLGPLGRFKVRELKQREIEEVNEPLVKRIYDATGKVTATTDNRGYHARGIAAALVNDDMSPVYGTMAEGVAIINEMPKDVVDVLWEAVDELNLLSVKAKDEVGKGSGSQKKDGGLS